MTRVVSVSLPEDNLLQGCSAPFVDEIAIAEFAASMSGDLPGVAFVVSWKHLPHFDNTYSAASQWCYCNNNVNSLRTLTVDDHDQNLLTHFFRIGIREHIHQCRSLANAQCAQQARRHRHRPRREEGQSQLFRGPPQFPTRCPRPQAGLAALKYPQSWASLHVQQRGGHRRGALRHVSVILTYAVL